jgi:hypothetical protein
MRRLGALALGLALAAELACGKYGPPVRPKATPAHGAQQTPAPNAPGTEPAQPPADGAAGPTTSDTEQCNDPNDASAGAKP